MATRISESATSVGLEAIEDVIPDSITSVIPKTLKNPECVMYIIRHALGYRVPFTIKGDPECSDKKLILAVSDQAKTPTVHNGMLVTLYCDAYDAFLTSFPEEIHVEDTLTMEKGYMNIIDELLIDAHRLGKEFDGDVNASAYTELQQKLFALTNDMYKNPIMTMMYPDDRLGCVLKSMIDTEFRSRGKFTAEYFIMGDIHC